MYRHFWILVKHVHAPSIDDIFPSHWITSRFTKKIRRNPGSLGSLNIPSSSSSSSSVEGDLTNGFIRQLTPLLTRVRARDTCRVCRLVWPRPPNRGTWEYVIPRRWWNGWCGLTPSSEILDDQRELEGWSPVADLTVFRERFSSGEIMRRQPDYVLNEHRSRFNPKAISFWSRVLSNKWPNDNFASWQSISNRCEFFFFFFSVIWFLLLPIWWEDFVRKEKWVFGLLFIYLVISKVIFWRLEKYNLFL